MPPIIDVRNDKRNKQNSSNLPPQDKVDIPSWVQNLLKCDAYDCGELTMITRIDESLGTVSLRCSKGHIGVRDLSPDRMRKLKDACSKYEI